MHKMNKKRLNMQKYKLMRTFLSQVQTANVAKRTAGVAARRHIAWVQVCYRAAAASCVA